MSAVLLRRTLGAIALASTACLLTTGAQAQEPKTPAPSSADALLDRATPSSALPAEAKPSNPRPAPAPGRVAVSPEPAVSTATAEKSAEQPVPETGFDEPRSERTVRADDRTVRPVVRDKARRAAAPVRARERAVERSAMSSSRRTQQASFRGDDEVRSKRRAAKSRPARNPGFDDRAGPRLSGLELARRAARRHWVEEREDFYDEPVYVERVVTFAPPRGRRLYVVEE